MGAWKIKNFSDFILEKSLSSSEGIFSRVFESSSKVDSYRTIALKLAEIFSLYGFFFGQKPESIKPGAWKGMMTDIAKISDEKEKWKKIMDLSTYLQGKIASFVSAPSGEFGSRGTYDYGTETEALPRATGYLKTASEVSTKDFTPEEKAKVMSILDRALLSVKPFTISDLVKESLNLLEKEKFLPPTNLDLLRVADTIGANLMRIYDELEVTKAAFPESETEINSFISASVLPAVDDLKNMIQNEIPNVGEKAAEGYMKKLNTFDGEVNKLAQKSQELRSKMNQQFSSNYASNSYEKSAQEIIDKVKKGIKDQGILNNRWVKTTDVVAGTTVMDPQYMGDAQIKSREAVRKKQKQRSADLAKHIIKKYQ